MRKYENFCNALSNMKDIYNYEEPYDNVVITGLVGLYEICFEQSWKMMKEILEIHGYAEGATGSPKIILKTAYKAGMIRDEEQWLRALQARNNVTHSYNQKIALGIIADAKEVFTTRPFFLFIVRQFHLFRYRRRVGLLEHHGDFP